MFGYLFGNLNNEINFVRGSFIGAERGDLLLIDAGLARAPSDRREEIVSRLIISESTVFPIARAGANRTAASPHLTLAGTITPPPVADRVSPLRRRCPIPSLNRTVRAERAFRAQL